jgi:hypothetical protein
MSRLYMNIDQQTVTSTNSTRPGAIRVPTKRLAALTPTLQKR